MTSLVIVALSQLGCMQAVRNRSWADNLLVAACRYLADAAPQKGEAAMRSGAQASDDDPTRHFKAQSQRLMGDMNDAGDAPFGGEMQVDSQVQAICGLHPLSISKLLVRFCCFS